MTGMNFTNFCSSSCIGCAAAAPFDARILSASMDTAAGLVVSICVCVLDVRLHGQT